MSGQPEHPEKVAGSPADPRYDGYRITEVWAWCVVDPADDQEGIPAAAVAAMPMPLLTTKKHLAEEVFGPLAQAVADKLGVDVTLRHFRLVDDEPTVTLHPSKNPEQRSDTP